MDNVDGKQARRTGQSSGLGELFEYAYSVHGLIERMLSAEQSRHRLFELHAGKSIRDGCYGAGTHAKRRLYSSGTMLADVLFYLGNIPYAHAISGIFQRTYRW